jgi:hypothetical protein
VRHYFQDTHKIDGIVAKMLNYKNRIFRNKVPRGREVSQWFPKILNKQKEGEFTKLKKFKTEIHFKLVLFIYGLGVLFVHFQHWTNGRFEYAYIVSENYPSVSNAFFGEFVIFTLAPFPIEILQSFLPKKILNIENQFLYEMAMLNGTIFISVVPQNNFIFGLMIC